MLKGNFQERTVELKLAQEPSVTLQFWSRSEMAQTSEQCCTDNTVEMISLPISDLLIPLETNSLGLLECGLKIVILNHSFQALNY